MCKTVSRCVSQLSTTVITCLRTPCGKKGLFCSWLQNFQCILDWLQCNTSQWRKVLISQQPGSREKGEDAEDNGPGARYSRQGHPRTHWLLLHSSLLFPSLPVLSLWDLISALIRTLAVDCFPASHQQSTHPWTSLLMGSGLSGHES